MSAARDGSKIQTQARLINHLINRILLSEGRRSAVRSSTGLKNLPPYTRNKERKKEREKKEVRRGENYVNGIFENLWPHTTHARIHTHTEPCTGCAWFSPSLPLFFAPAHTHRSAPAAAPVFGQCSHQYLLCGQRHAPPVPTPTNGYKWKVKCV